MFAGPSPLLFGGASRSGLRPQDLFATRLHGGDGTAGKRVLTPFAPDFTWIKERSANSYNHNLMDRVRGTTSQLSSSLTWSEGQFQSQAPGTYVTSFDADGVTLGTRPEVNGSGLFYSDILIKRAPKFFDIITYTGDGSSNRVIPHGLGIKPGMMIFKGRSQGTSGIVYHRSIGAGNVLILDTTQAQISYGAGFSGIEPTDTGIALGSALNSNGISYVAWLFAHDPDTTNGIVQCGNFTTNSAGTIASNVFLGWRPQFLLFKSFEAPTNWEMYDSSRGLASFDSNPQAASKLFANLSNAEQGGNSPGTANVDTMATGFRAYNTLQANVGHIYLAIRAPVV